jgi:hypothetical protein
VLRLHGSEATYAYHDHGRAAAPGRVASTDDAARRAVERAVGTGWSNSGTYSQVRATAPPLSKGQSSG